jgi:hypothetical protein
MSDRLLPIFKAITKIFSKPLREAAGTSIAIYLLKRPEARGEAAGPICPSFTFHASRFTVL